MTEAIKVMNNSYKIGILAHTPELLPFIICSDTWKNHYGILFINLFPFIMTMVLPNKITVK